jgi:methyl-accepting chemotaxis protein PixJ
MTLINTLPQGKSQGAIFSLLLLSAFDFLPPSARSIFANVSPSAVLKAELNAKFKNQQRIPLAGIIWVNRDRLVEVLAMSESSSQAWSDNEPQADSGEPSQGSAAATYDPGEPEERSPAPPLKRPTVNSNLELGPETDPVEGGEIVLAPPPAHRRGWSLRRKAVLTALALTTLPVIALGTVTYLITNRYLGLQLYQVRQESAAVPDTADLHESLRRQLQLTLGLGTGMTAIVTAAIALSLVNRSLRSVGATAAAAADTAKLLRRADSETGEEFDLKERDEWSSLQTDLSLLSYQIPDLLKQQEEEGERTELLTKVALQVRESSNLEQLLEIAVREVRQAFKVDRIVFFRLEPDGSGTIAAESVTAGFPKILGTEINDPCFAARHIELYRNGRIRAIDDIYRAQMADCYLDMLEKFSVRANLIAPVLREGQLLGLLIAHQCSGPRVWQQAEIKFFARLATQISFAVAQRSLAEDLQSEAIAEQQLLETTSRIRESLNLKQVVATTVKETRKALDAERVLFYRFKPKGNGIVIGESLKSGISQVTGTASTNTWFQESHMEQYRQGKVKAIDNVDKAGLTESDPDYLKLLHKFSIKATLIAPVTKGEQLLGLLMAHQCSKPRTWKLSEINLFGQLARQVGFALDHAFLLERMEQSRQEVEGALRPRNRAIAAASFGISIADALHPECPIIYCNPAFEKITGYTQAEATGRNCRFLQGPDTDPAALTEIRRAIREQRDCHVVLKNYRKDGSPFWNELTISPVRDDRGDVTHYIGLQTDITNQLAIATQVHTAAESVAHAAQSNAAAIQLFSTATAEQPNKIAEVQTSLQTLDTAVAGLMGRAQQIKLSVEQVQQRLNTGDEVMGQTEVEMVSTHRTLIETAKQLRHLLEICGRVGEVIHPVHDFASQANTLAMSVALEVGRSTSQIENQSLINVAESLRALSQRSTSATTAVEFLTDEVQNIHQQLLAAMEFEAERLLSGSQLTKESRHKLDEIVVTNAQAGWLADEMSQIARDYTAASATLRRTVESVAANTHEIQSQSAAVANAFTTLMAVAQTLQASVTKLEKNDKNE